MIKHKIKYYMVLSFQQTFLCMRYVRGIRSYVSYTMLRIIHKTGAISQELVVSLIKNYPYNDRYVHFFLFNLSENIARERIFIVFVLFSEHPKLI